MAVSLSSFPSTYCLGHGDESRNHSPTKHVIVHRPSVARNGTGFEGVQHERQHRTRLGHALRHHYTSSKVGRLVVTEATKGSRESEENVPSWAKPESDEAPPWARNEGVDRGGGSTTQEGFELPFFVYLLASAITAIAAIGSVFEYVNKKPVFGVLASDSIFYAPVLGFFALTGIPTSAFLWFKSVQAANKEAEEQDRSDGFL